MKLIICVILLSCLGQIVSAQLLEQKISIDVQDESFEAILDQLAEEYEIVFSYSRNKISLKQHATITKANTSIKVVLDELTAAMILEYKVIGKLIVFKKATSKPTVVQLKKKAVLIPTSPIVHIPSNPDIQVRSTEPFVSVSGIGQYRFIEGQSEPIIILGQAVDSQNRTDNNTTSRSKRFDIDYRKPKKIVEEAFNRIEQNFSVQSFHLDGFYREVHKENKKAISVVDAVVDIYDKGYKPIKWRKNKVKEKVRLHQVRASKSYMQEEYKSDFQSFNSLDGILKWNKIKYRDPNTEKNLGKRQYRMDSVINTAEGPIYVISASVPAWRYRNKITYYIDGRTYVIKKVSYLNEANKGFYLPQQWKISDDKYFELKAKSTLMVYEFGYHQEKIFLTKCTETSSADVYNRNRKAVEWEFGCNRTLVITDVNKRMRGMARTTLMNSKKSLELQAPKYDPEFWNNYSFPKQLPIRLDQIKELEWEKPLGKQFKESGFLAGRQPL